MAIPKASIAELLQQHRAAAGLTQEELAERAKLSARSISDLERGVARHPYPHTMQRLVQALGLDAEVASRFEMAARRNGMAAGEGAHDPAAVAIPSGLDRTTLPMHLPLQLTSFVGRQQEMREVIQLVQREDVRLLTLTGPGGVGKTRLALRAAEESAALFPDGGVFISLASLADPELVPSAIATALGVTAGSGQSILEAVTGYLRSQQLLMVLDNFEHLLSATEMISQLLITCPQLTILVTSRAVLHLAAEHEYPVPPLPAPIPGHLPDLASLSRYDAIQLFVQRAEAIKPGFELTDQSAAAVAEICYRLDGLPLAIELAAARIRLFPPHALLQRLGNRLGLLTGGPRDQPPRQQTLQKTIDWSYGLLGKQEQVLFARLSVFAGGWTLEAAEAVCNPEGESHVLDGMTVLLEQSLVHQMGDEEPRFSMLETLREYAAQKLDECGQGNLIRSGHADVFLHIAEKAEPQLTGPAQGEWLARLDVELDNLRAALWWFLDSRAINEELRLAAALERFWHARGYVREERRWLEAGLVQGDGVIPGVRAKALWTLGRVSWLQARLPRAVEVLQEALELYRELGDRRGMALTLNMLGNVAGDQGPVEQEIALHRESLRLWRELGDLAESARPLQNLGIQAAARGDTAAAREQIGEALAIYRTVGDIRGIAHTLLTLGRVALQEDDPAEAESLCAESVALSRKLGTKPWIAEALLTMGVIARKQGRLDIARERLQECALLFRQLGDTRARLAVLWETAALAAERGGPERAIRIKGAETALRESAGFSPSASGLVEEEQMLAHAREMLGEAEFVRTWEAGRAMNLEEAVAQALDESR